MSLCSEISLHSSPHWTRAYSLFNDDDKDSVLLYPELLLSPLNKSLVLKTFNSSDVVCVGEYKIRASLSSTLQTIFDKYGDITSDSKLQSLSTRTYHLETLAEIVIELQSVSMHRLSETRAGESSEQVGSGPSSRKLLRQRGLSKDAVVMEKEACERDLLLAKQEMELSVKNLAEKEKEMNEFRERLMKTVGKLGSLEMKQTCLDKRIAFLRSKVEKFQGQSVFNDIL